MSPFATTSDTGIEERYSEACSPGPSCSYPLHSGLKPRDELPFPFAFAPIRPLRSATPLDRGSRLARGSVPQPCRGWLGLAQSQWGTPGR